MVIEDVYAEIIGSLRQLVVMESICYTNFAHSALTHSVETSCFGALLSSAGKVRVASNFVIPLLDTNAAGKLCTSSPRNHVHVAVVFNHAIYHTVLAQLGVESL